MKNLFLVGLLMLFLPGCAAMPPYDEVDYGKTVDGKTYMRDTPRTWKYLKWEIDEGINLELKGKPPGGGFKSWNEARVHGILHFRNSGQVENPEKYIAYLIEQRRKAGLPEIVFPEPEKAPKAKSAPSKKDKGDANSLFGRGS
jgi:hypothetical protein